MAHNLPQRDADHDQAPAVEHDDVILLNLHQAERFYRDFRANWEQQAAELATARTELTRLAGAQHEAEVQLGQQAVELRNIRNALTRSEAEHRETAEEADQQRQQADHQQQRAEQQRQRADQLAAYLKDIHRSLFRGDVYNLLLKACLSLTGATRGLYLTAQGPGAALRIRAAVNIDGYPQTAPSPYINAVCQQVLERNDTFVCNNADDVAGLPAPTQPAEQFHNCAAAPAALLKNFHGIILVADKPNGDFDEHDIETLVSVGDQAAVAVENMQLQHDLQGAYLSTVSMLADVVEAKDPYTLGHCEDVSRYARLVGERLHLTGDDQSVVCYAALLHDVGKIGVSDGILNKPGALLPEERELIRSHVRVGHDLIMHVPVLSPVAEVVLHHHEWYDGSGYPDRLIGEAIPIAARIVSVVDAYCAMITRRSYKEAYSDERAQAELVRCAGTQFDPRVVEAFIEVLASPAAHNDEDSMECGLLPGFERLHLPEHGGG